MLSMIRLMRHRSFDDFSGAVRVVDGPARIDQECRRSVAIASAKGGRNAEHRLECHSRYENRWIARQ